MKEGPVQDRGWGSGTGVGWCGQCGGCLQQGSTAASQLNDHQAHQPNHGCAPVQHLSGRSEGAQGALVGGGQGEEGGDGEEQGSQANGCRDGVAGVWRPVVRARALHT